MVRNMWLLQTTLDMDKDRGPGHCSFGTIRAGGLMKLARMWRRVASQASQTQGKKSQSATANSGDSGALISSARTPASRVLQ